MAAGRAQIVAAMTTGVAVTGMVTMVTGTTTKNLAMCIGRPLLNGSVTLWITWDALLGHFIRYSAVYQYSYQVFSHRSFRYDSKSVL